MRKLYQEYFHVPQGGKIREKVMLARVAATVIIVVLCLAAMGFTAYAYFSVDLTYGSNTITAANFDIEVTIEPTAGDPVAVTREGNLLSAQLDEGMYTVTLKHTEGSTAQTGFVILSADTCDDTYYTTQIGKGGELSFTIQVGKPTKVSFLAHWGTSSYYDKYKEIGDTFFIKENGSVVLVSSAAGEPVEEPTVPDTENDGTDEPSSDPATDPAPEPSEPEAPAEPEPSNPTEPENPAEDPAEPEPGIPAEEPTEPESPAEDPAGAEPETPAEEPTEPEPTEPEAPGEEPSETTDPAVDSPEEPSEPADEPVDEWIDGPVG